MLGPGQAGQAAFNPSPAKPADKYVDGLWQGKARERVDRGGDPPGHGLPAAAAVVADTTLGSGLGRVLIRLFGRPSFRTGACSYGEAARGRAAGLVHDRCASGAHGLCSDVTFIAVITDWTRDHGRAGAGRP